jgi:hypothetical protein
MTPYIEDKSGLVLYRWWLWKQLKDPIWKRELNKLKGRELVCQGCKAGKHCHVAILKRAVDHYTKNS